MNFVVSKSDLQNAISTVIKAVPLKSNLSNADCILIEARMDEVRLVANNMEMAIECIIPANVLEEGKICMESKFLQDTIRKFPDDDINISTDNNLKTTIICESIVYSVSGKETETFNDIPNFDIKEHMTIKEFSLKEIIRQTIFSISDNEANKTLRGELFEIKNGMLRVISLDGQRVSIRKIEINDKELNKKIIEAIIITISGSSNHLNLKFKPAMMNASKNVIPLIKITIFCSCSSSFAFNLLFKSSGDLINAIIPTTNIGINNNAISSQAL